jgi:prepilin-type N-terminal cleavage/methylation domain-containing protein
MTARRTHSDRRGFTMVELLVVVAIFVLLISLAVPAFSSMLYSSERSMAENALRIGIASARDAATRSARGEDGAAVFFYEPGVGYTIVPYVLAGTMQDHDASSNDVRRELFVPAAGYEPVQLPRSWMVRGLAVANSMDDQWYADSGTAWNNNAVRQRANWVFPETGFYDTSRGDEGRKRQTFMVRFEGGTGVLKPLQSDPVLVLAPAPSLAFRNTGNFANYRVDRDDQPRRFVRRVLAVTTGAGPNLKRELLGDLSTDTVLAKPVPLLALYNERGMASVVGASIGRETGCIYTNMTAPEFVPPSTNAVTFTDRMNQWLEARMANADSDASIYGIHRYLGHLEDVSGTFAGVNP